MATASPSAPFLGRLRSSDDPYSDETFKEACFQNSSRVPLAHSSDELTN